ncbi:hypothetical protein DYL59_14715 [Pseudomonas kairouanensis]|uniref:Uncharacterized protein n=1 Tax=Pseudomonas kairouanensis TaxID=2293832 RepID=A0A4Z0ARQ2_9PSED|nr:hypothetical protein [Pseudomonas kairouanensis]TFY88638.1 hypothetical protein DYL59_14715 [Pseudomonas kairouanensis]
MDFHYSTYTSFVSSIHRLNSQPAQHNASHQPKASETALHVPNAQHPAKKTNYRSGMDNLNRNSPL